MIHGSYNIKLVKVFYTQTMTGFPVIRFWHSNVELKLLPKNSTKHNYVKFSKHSADYMCYWT